MKTLHFVLLVIFFGSVIMIPVKSVTGYDASFSFPVSPGPIHYSSLSQDTVWEGEILVEDHVLVEPGATLTIMPGARVQFQYYRGYKEPERRLSMHAEGRVVAEGTPDNPIYFTSSAPDPCNGDWSMVHLEGTSQSIFRYCVFEFGQQGINVWQGSPILSHCVFRWHNWEGMYFESYCEPMIDHCRILENGYNGLACEQFNTVTMDSCKISRSGTHGVHIDASTLEIRCSWIYDNHASGLSVDNSGILRALGVAIVNNRDCGIGFGEGTNTVEISNLFFRDNWGADICGWYTEISSPYHPPDAIDFKFEPDDSCALGYVPGDSALDRYTYVYPDDETRCIVTTIGEGLGLTWSLAWDGQYIWTVTLWGDLFKLDPLTGDILQHFSNIGSQPWGMTYDGEHLWVVDFAEKRISEIDPATGGVLATYPTPDTVGGCKGVTWDGTYLNIMGWTSPTIYRMDRQGNVHGTIELEYGGGGGIAWDGSHFWVPGGRILKYDREGRAAGWIYPASEGTWDMTWDGQYLWASQRTNENWSDAKIFRLLIIDDHSGEVETGDVNGDGGVDIVDVLTVVRYILGEIDFTTDQWKQANCQKDCGIDVLDAVGLVNLILGTGTCEPWR